MNDRSVGGRDTSFPKIKSPILSRPLINGKVFTVHEDVRCRTCCISQLKYLSHFRVQKLRYDFFQEEQIVFAFVFLGVCTQALQSCPTLCDRSPLGSSVHGILQARILERVAITSFRSFQPRDQTHISCVFCIAGRFFTAEPPGKPHSYS